jgi:hypothetical protein
MADVSSQWYPYINVHESYYDLSNATDIPRKICDYLIDAPKGNYFPVDDNKYSRCRFWKYLFYDGSKPLNNSLPSVEEKMSVVFDPNNPEDPPTSKGYRLIPQIFVKESQTNAQSRVYCYMGRTIPSDNEYKISISVVFMILTHYTYELNTKTDEYSRAFAIEQALIEAFHGVNMAGVGTFYFSRAKHPDCGSRAMYDGKENVGRELTMCLEIATNDLNNVNETNNMPFANKSGTIRLA